MTTVPSLARLTKRTPSYDFTPSVLTLAIRLTERYITATDVAVTANEAGKVVGRRWHILQVEQTREISVTSHRYCHDLKLAASPTRRWTWSLRTLSSLSALVYSRTTIRHHPTGFPSASAPCPLRTYPSSTSNFSAAPTFICSPVVA